MSLLDRAVALALPAVPKPIVRRFARRYIAGTSSDDAFRMVRQLRDEGAMATLDILGEFIKTPDQAAVKLDAYRKLVDKIADERLPETNLSIKLTALGLLIDPELCLENTRKLMEEVAARDNFVRIDMEDSNCTTDTLAIYRTLRQEFPGRVGAVLQSRLRRSLDDTDALTDGHTANFRLCKGIYLEPPAIAYTDAEEIRRNFVQILERMFARGAYVGIATHDDALISASLDLIRRYGRTREQYEFQMLLGVAEPLRRSILDAGHRLRVYVPYGEEWYPYSVRRLRENPQIAGYAFKAMFKRG